MLHPVTISEIKDHPKN